MNGAKAWAVASVVAVAFASPSMACADDGLRVNRAVDVPVAVGGVVTWLGSEALKPSLAAEPCRWCASNAFDEDVRSRLKWDDIDAGDRASNVTAFLLAPLAAIGMDALSAAHDGRRANVQDDVLVIVEATVLAANLNQIVKFTVGRERPFVHAMTDEEKSRTRHPSDNNTSFYSGHTNLAFVLAVSSGTVATMREYRWAPWVWVVGLGLAGTTGFLRIAGDRHYASDVLTGAAVASVIGYAIPRYLHDDATSSAVTIQGGRRSGSPIVAVAWAF